MRDSIVAIGIQARSTSNRFPNKVMANILGRPMIDWVIENVNSSCRYINRCVNDTLAMSFLLIPEKDALSKRDNGIRILEGSERDVLSRYKKMADISDADYIVRVTGDCPLIRDALISKLVTICVKDRHDYASNVDERMRLSLDGYDCEVVSRRLFNHVCDVVKKDFDREHVTTYIRDPINHAEISDFSIANMIPLLDLSGVKLSVDLPEDIENVEHHLKRQLWAKNKSVELHGSRSVYYF